MLALPKGHLDPGETPAAAALREVREEAGVESTVREELGDVRYLYMRDGRRIAKVVTFFLLDYVAGDGRRPRPRGRGGALDARWRRRPRSLTYEGERDMAAARPVRRASG